MNTPENLLYTKDHEWLKIEGNTATVGITDFAQNSLGDIVFLELPEVGAELKLEESFGVVESIKSVSDLYAPISGKVLEINEELADSPENINTAPYESWLVKLDMSNSSETEKLMSDKNYNDHCANPH